MMGSPEPRSSRLELIRALMNRLCAPDLTLGEAKALRDRLNDLLAQGGEGGSVVDEAPASMRLASRKFGRLTA